MKVLMFITCVGYSFVLFKLYWETLHNHRLWWGPVFFDFWILIALTFSLLYIYILYTLASALLLSVVGMGGLSV